MAKGGFKGIPGGAGGLQGFMQQAKKMQMELQKVQEQAKEQIVEVQSGGGMVKLQMNGDYQILNLTISPDVIDPQDPEMLQDLVRAAFTEAITSARTKVQSAMEKVTGGMGVPDLF